MNFGLVFFIVVIAGLFLLRSVLTRKRAEVANEPDPGSAIVAFGMAFPDEAVRAVVRTADGRCTFLRLADGKTGFVREEKRRDIARIVEPDSARMASPPDARSLSMTFDDAGEPVTFVFSSSQEAAEVALWLFGSFSRRQRRGVDEGG